MNQCKIVKNKKILNICEHCIKTDAIFCPWNDLMKQWLYLDRAQTTSPTVQLQCRWRRFPFPHYDIQSYTDKPPRCPSSSSYSTACESGGGQAESHSQPLRAKAVTRRMKLFSLDKTNLQEIRSMCLTITVILKLVRNSLYAGQTMYMCDSSSDWCININNRASVPP